MELRDLSDDELLALMGLAKQVVRADGVTSDAELEALQDLADRAGDARWKSVFPRARAELSDRVSFDAVVAGVERPEAREAIYDALVVLAGSDDVVVAEARVLDHLATLWDLGDAAPLAPAIKPG